MHAEVDWEQIYQAEILAQQKTANRPLSAMDKFNYMLQWEKEIAPQLRVLVNCSANALADLDKDALNQNLSLVETELLMRTKQYPKDLIIEPYSHPDYTVLLPEGLIDLHPVLDKTFPLLGDVRIIHPILAGAMAQMIERDNRVIKALRPVHDKSNGPTFIITPTLH